MSGRKGVRRALRRGIGYLEAARKPDGHWEDFGIAGLSDMWTSAYVGAMVAEVGSEEAKRLAAGALRWLRGEASEGRWAYSHDAPLDADTTTWVWRLARRLDERMPESTDAFLREHVGEDGLLSTFVRRDYEAKFGPESVDRTGWYSGHVCVTAPAACLEGAGWRDRLLAGLRARQQRAGFWKSYWWLDPEYATAFAVEAFRGRPDADGCLSGARQWLESRTGESGRVATIHFPSGSPFATGLALRSLVDLAGPTPGTDAMAEWLVERQDDDGGWAPSAALRLPYPDDPDPDLDHWLPRADGRTIWNTPLLDQEGLHTSATVLSGLARYLRAGDGRG